MVVIDKFNNFVIDGVIVRDAHFSKRATYSFQPDGLVAENFSANNLLTEVIVQSCNDGFGVSILYST